MISTPLEMALQFKDLKEVKGLVDNPMILSFLRVDDKWPEHDEVAWCSGFMNFICKCCLLSRSKSLAAISWANIGRPINSLEECMPGFDIVVLTRNGGNHVGFYTKHDKYNVWLLGGNQGDSVNIAPFNKVNVIAIRRLN